MKQLALVLSVPLLLAGCSADFLSQFLPGKTNPSQRDDCTVTVERPAPMFYLDAPQVASAGATFSVEPWVLLSAPVQVIDAIRPETFVAEVDLAAKKVTLRGKITRHEANPQANCGFPAIYMLPKAATLSVPVSLPAGTYELAIAADSFNPEKPPYTPMEPNRTYPGPLATRSIVVE
ncbi:hypothetical protein D3C86_521770 [compost metagenome]